MVRASVGTECSVTQHVLRIVVTVAARNKQLRARHPPVHWPYINWRYLSPTALEPAVRNNVESLRNSSHPRLADTVQTVVWMSTGDGVRHSWPQLAYEVTMRYQSSVTVYPGVLRFTY